MKPLKQGKKSGKKQKRPKRRLPDTIRAAIIGGLFALLCVGLYIYFLRPKDSSLEIVKANFPIPSVLDITVRNVGDQSAVITEITAHVEKIWTVIPTFTELMYLEASNVYKLSLPLKAYPYDVTTSTSQLVKGRDVDRFFIELGVDEPNVGSHMWPGATPLCANRTCNYVFLVSLSLRYDQARKQAFTDKIVYVSGPRGVYNIDPDQMPKEIPDQIRRKMTIARNWNRSVAQELKDLKSEIASDLLRSINNQINNGGPSQPAQESSESQLFVSLPQNLMSLSEVKSGMRGIGKTVFKGTEIEEFDVGIIGLVRNFFAPHRHLILASIGGENIQKYGVPLGMSGSPVLIDGRIIGGVSYRLPFAEGFLVGITPIEYMVEQRE